ncbi:beta-N-acetylhexosaminidase [Streptomyces sp. NPDC058657]|uniref:beta-N-acetylhexosaminidase n=1 Tax=unclassified Streptomyces TaxID=2593676 RepID=UPI00364A23B0
MRPRRTIPRLLAPLLLVATASFAAVGAAAPDSAQASAPRQAAAVPLGKIVPAPAAVQAGGQAYTLNPRTAIRVDRHSAEAQKVGSYLADVLRPSTGYPLPLTDRGGRDTITLELGARSSSLGEEGYWLKSGKHGVTITARRAAGLFHGVQTLRQLLPPAVEKKTRQPGPWQVSGGTIKDVPRFGHRGVMLDVGRHFLTVSQVKRYIDQAALYKMNKLHMHLTEDQGWRIAINSWPRLATYGGSTQVGGGPGGYYTKQQYKDLVKYAASRHMEVIPEVDMPGHTNAALASYADLNCDGVAPPLYTGTEVGFSSLCAGKDITYRFIEDVLGEIAELTPGRYLNIGGDEAHATSHEDFVRIMDHAQDVVGRHGKQIMGWHQLVGARPVEGRVAQYWGYDRTSEAERRSVVEATRAGTKLVLSPADRAYLDMKYHKATPLGLNWAGYVEVDRSYDWDPGTYLQGVPESSVLGVEAPLWTETLATSDQLEFMAFPRLPGIAELGWSPRATHDWNTYKVRLAAQGPRFDALGIDYYRSAKVPWPAR